jgi:hypothetical protein
MAVIELSKEQVFDLVRQMPPDQKREILLLLAGNGMSQRQKRQEFAEQQLRRLCVERGLNWDTMSPEQRENFIDDLIHEDRPCSQ